jgi:alpha-1,2-mannosyltransferase
MAFSVTSLDVRRVPQLLRWCGLLAALVISSWFLNRALHGYLMDLSVFRDAGHALRTGKSLYDNGFADGFRFIYPPFAAVLFVPLTLVGGAVLQTAWTVATIAALWWTLWAACKRLDLTAPVLTSGALLAVALLLEPVRSNLEFGQINVFLMALVVADVLKFLPERWRGVGIGIAAAIKVTPAAFVLILLLRRDFRSVARAAAAVVGTMVIGLICAPTDSRHFWSSEFFDTNRAGQPDFHRNQSLTGLLARLGLHGFGYNLLWVLGAGAVVAAAAWAAYRFLQSGQDVAAVAVIGLAHLIAAPFAVTHHWVWVVLALPLAIAPRYRHWWPVLVAVLVIFFLAPHSLLDMPKTGEGVSARFVIGNSQLLIAIAAVFAAAAAVTWDPRTYPGAMGGAGATPEADGAGGTAEVSADAEPLCADCREPVGRR